MINDIASYLSKYIKYQLEINSNFFCTRYEYDEELA